MNNRHAPRRFNDPCEGSAEPGTTPVGGADSSLAAVERAMVRIRRSQTRRTLGAIMNQRLDEPVDFTLLGVVDAVEEGPDRPGHEVTVGAVAESLGIDPSRASRVVAAAIRAGYVERLASQVDGRRIRLALTDAGRELAQTAHRFRQAYFDEIMHEWTDEERQQFARLLTKFTESLTDTAGR